MEGKKQIGMGLISYGQKRENKIRLLFIFIKYDEKVLHDVRSFERFDRDTEKKSP
jgi:hypothetical protein